MSSKNSQHLLLKAEKARSKREYLDCIRLCNAIIKKNPQEITAYEIKGLASLEIKEYREADEMGKQVMELDPRNANGAMIRSVALMSTGQDALAILVLEHQLSVTPDILPLLFNLHTACTAVGQNQKALEIAVKAVQLDPTNADAFNNLGASLHSVARPKDAVIAFQTAVDLNPRQYTARLNLANTLTNDDNKIIDEIEFVIKEAKDKISERAMVGAMHNTAFPYLRIGNLEKGWERLEYGFSPLIDSGRGRRPKRKFIQPRWTGESLVGKTLLVWREQGLGDEIMFGTYLHEIAQIDGKVILECEPRLVKIMTDSFPAFSVRAEIYRGVFPFDSPHHDFDYQIPIGSLAGLYRKRVEDFDRAKPYLKTDPTLKAKYAQRLLKAAGNNKKIGICWRSGLVSPIRDSSYTKLTDWHKLFTAPNISIVNLQYGTCEEEIVEVEKQFNIKIIRWDDTNLQSDLDSVAAIIDNLDVVCTVGTAVAQISGAVGANTILCDINYGWTSFGTKKFVYFPNIKLIVDEVNGDMEVAVDMAANLALQ